MTAPEEKPGGETAGKDGAAPPVEKAQAMETAGKTGGNGEAAPPPAGLTLADAKELLLRKHKAHVDDDDALLMEVTLHEAFLGDYERMLEHHRKAVRTVMEESAKSTVETIRKAAEGLRSETLESSVRDKMAQVGEYAARCEKAKDGLLSEMSLTMKRHLFAHGALTFASGVFCLVTVLVLLAQI